jgi:hypothetical protein
MKTLCLASFCFLPLATTTFAASVTVVDNATALPGTAAATAATTCDLSGVV